MFCKHFRMISVVCYMNVNFLLRGGGNLFLAENSNSCAKQNEMFSTTNAGINLGEPFTKLYLQKTAPLQNSTV